ncbi:MAG TPA: sigma factor-like helix-turn-helix DNA-binding protein [Jatrophihabitans sp.]|nr:sigma factor-like helix-turn-helix DNA-binding protein [Jatrophihabitans sp.]
MTLGGFGQLIAAARRGDAHAFGLLWQQTNPGLRRYLRVVARDQVDLVAALTWQELVRTLPRFRGGEAQWQTRVFATARASQRRAGAMLAPAPAPVPLGRRGLGDVMTGLALDLLAGLEPVEREVLVLRASARMSVAQIAEITRLNQPSVRTAARNALARASILASDPAVRRRLVRGAPSLIDDDTHNRAALPGPMPSETVLEDLLAGRPASPGAGARTRLMAGLVAALAAPPTLEELRGLGPPYPEFRRQFDTAPRHRRVTVRFGSRVAVAAGIVSIAMSGTVVAAYGGALPDRLQDVAHDWLNAPPANGGEDGAPAPDTTSAPTRQRPRRRAPGSGSAPGGGSTRHGHRGAGPTAHPTSASKPPGAANQPPGGGAAHTPPGSSGTPPAGGATPPGPPSPPDSTTPPGPTKTPPKGGKTPPGSTKSPPKGGKTPPGHGTTKTQALPTTATKTKTPGSHVRAP